MALVAKVTVSHRGKVYEPGSELPADVPAERLVRLGYACAGDGSCPDCEGHDAPVKPVRRAPAKKRAG